MKFLTILFVTVGLIYGGYKWLYPTIRWNERLTITVSTPDGIKTGASVVRHQVVSQPKVLPDVPSRLYTLKGEAVVVDLGGGKYLFALLKGQRRLGSKVLKTVYKARRDNKKPRPSDEIGHVPTNLIPVLVTFDDVHDPSSIKLVDPKNLAATFGAEYALQGMVIPP